MACFHKFNNHELLNGLLPSWECRTLIIGTFNPENKFHTSNDANFFYQRSKNFFWDVFPLLSGVSSINKKDITRQLEHLKKYRVGITDLLISINDADETNEEHKRLIKTVKDNDIELFNEFSWNTNQIIEYINDSKIEAVFFTKLGKLNINNIQEDTFEYQMRMIVRYCNLNNIYNKRLHTPSGQGLNEKGPKIPNLYNRWVNVNGPILEYFQ